MLTYYNPARLLGYNGTYNFIVGPRGNGKTYAFKKRAIRSALRNGRKFIYLRRYKPELAASAPTFFTDIAHEFPTHDFRTQGKYAQASPKLKDGESEKTRKWTTIGYFLALSVSGSYKSVSFHDVDEIMYDEFITKNKTPGYLQSEFVAFNEFYSTVDRWNDRVRVFFISNSVSIMNPYFIALEIRPDQIGKKITALFPSKVTNRPFVVIELIHSEKFKSEVFQTSFGQFISETDPEYSDYAVNNEFNDGHEKLISDKTSSAEYLFTVETVKHGRFSVWHDSHDGTFYVRSRLPKVERVFTMDRNRMEEGKTFVKYNDGPFAKLRTAYNTARIKFDKPGTRNAFAEIMDKK